MKSSKSLNFSAGTILWLPAKDEIVNEHLDVAGTIDDGCFDHPVLILAEKPGKKEVVILMITSFGGMDLLERHPRNDRTRSQHLPIYPSKSHPDNGSQLFLVNNFGLRKNSYINIEVQRTVRTVLLRRTRHSTCTLRADSYDYLIKIIGFTPPLPPPKPHIRIFPSTPNAFPALGTWPNIAHSTPVHHKHPAPAHFIYPPPTHSAQTVSTRSTQYAFTPTPTQSAQTVSTRSTKYAFTPTPTHSAQTVSTRSTKPKPTPNHYTPATPNPYTPAIINHYTPATPNHYTHPIPARYTHSAPALSTHSNDRSGHIHRQTERTPLLPTVYHRTQPRSEESSDCSGSSIVILFIVVTAFILWAVWRMAGGA